MDAKGPAHQQTLSQRTPAAGQSNHLHNQDENTEVDTVKLAAHLLDTNKQAEFLEIVRELRQCLDERTSECGLLKIKLSESDVRVEALSRELNGCKLTMFQNGEDSSKLHEEVTKSKRLEEDYVKLMSSYLTLEERYEQHRHNLYNNYLAKTNAINNYECIKSREVMKYGLEQCKGELHQKIAEVNLVSAKLRNLEEDNNTKENCITELRKSLDDAKVAHKHEITVLEEYIQCLKNTITSYEKTLASYLDDRQHMGQVEPASEETPSMAERDRGSATLNTTTVTVQNEESGDI